ncbi:MAG: hypothetical protein MUQ65_07275 [Armatimonadetes bacterium]|nr:hypothetical protein [Armatimonadota bacterium]
MATLAERDTTGTLTPGEGEIELLDRRTRNAKVFHLGGRRYRIGASLGPVHYRRDPFDEQEELKEIDLSLVPTPGEAWDFACETNGYQVRVWNSREVGARTLRCVAQFRRAGRWFEMAPVALLWMNGAGERELIAKPVASAPTVEQEPDRVLWHDAFGAGLDFCYTLTSDHFWKAVIVREKAALPRPMIGLAGLRLVVVMSAAWGDGARAGNGFADTVETTLDDDENALDAADEELREPEGFDYGDTADRPLWWLRKPRAWDSGEERQGFEMGWELRRRGGVVLMLLGIDARVLADESVAYPVYIDTVMTEEAISASSDDAYSYGTTHPGSTTLSTNGNYTLQGGSTTTFYIAGYRFQTIPIPPGVTVDSASLTVRSGGVAGDGQTDWRVVAEDVDNAATFSAGHKPSDAYAVKTAASVRWTDAGGDWAINATKVSPSLVGPVGEVLARPGWALNAALVILIANWSTSFESGIKYRTIRTYDYSVSYVAKFNCTYTEPPPAGGDWLFASD